MTDDDHCGPEPCYFCGKSRDDYFRLLCDDCRDKARQLEKSISDARTNGKDGAE